MLQSAVEATSLAAWSTLTTSPVVVFGDFLRLLSERVGLVGVRVCTSRGVEETLMSLLSLWRVVRGLVGRRVRRRGELVLARPLAALALKLIDIFANDGRNP